MNDHDCNELHYDGEFTITFFNRSKASEELLNWFEKVFKRQHPQSHVDFQLTWEPDADSGERLEIAAYNPMFSASALVSLFEAFRASGLEINAALKPQLVS